MRLTTLVAAALLPAAALAQVRPSDAPPSLRVLRHTPDDTASTGNVITITFDRPVAGRIEGMIDPQRILRIAPAIAGRVEWRDPITLRFTPNDPLKPGDRFSVTVDTTFTAMDGTRLEAPHRFTFRVPSARLIGRSFDTQGQGTLPWNGRIFLLYSSAVESGFLARGIRLELPVCGSAAAQAVTYRAVDQRPLRPDDPYVLSYARQSEDTTGYRFQRVVVLEPTRALPPACRGTLVIANTEEDTTYGRTERFGIRTADVFRLSAFHCDYEEIPPPPGCNLPNLVLSFTEQVQRDSLIKYVHLEPSIALDRTKLPEQSADWKVAVRFTPRTTYRVSIDPKLRDIGGRRIRVDGPSTLVVGDYWPGFVHAVGVVSIPVAATATIPVEHVNVRRLRVIALSVPPADRSRTLWLTALNVSGTPRMLPETSFVTLRGNLNEIRTTDVTLPPHATARGMLVELRMEVVDGLPASGLAPPGRPLDTSVRHSRDAVEQAVFVQRTDLTADMHLGSSGGFVRVVRESDGHSVAGARVRLRDPQGTLLVTAHTNDSGLARLTMPSSKDSNSLAGSASLFGTIEVATDADSVITPLLQRAIGFRPMNPLNVNALGGRLETPSDIRATLHADRDIYRPGEMIYLRGIVRRGALGALALPAPGDSVRLTVRNRPTGWYDVDEDAPIRDTVLALNNFGVVADSFATRRGTRLGNYLAELRWPTNGRLDRTPPAAQLELRIAEYRAPEFLVDVAADSAPRYAGDTILLRTSSRYLFGAPMRRARVQWRAVLSDASGAIRIPGAEREGWTVGARAWWREDGARKRAQELWGEDALDERGQLEIRIPVSSLRPDRAGSVAIDVAVTDVNRQVVSAGTRVRVYPSRVFVLARERSSQWLWRVGERVVIDTRVTRADGSDVVGVPVTATVLRLRWTPTQWKEDTVAVDTLRSVLTPAQFSYVPPLGAMYVVRFSANDGRGGTARTDVGGYAVGSEWRLPRDNPYHLPLIADKRELEVGDTTRVVFESPFDSATAWITIERERVLAQRALRVSRGSNVVPLVIEARHVPNVFVSVSLRPLGPPQRQPPDSAHELLRVGYVELHVVPDSRRLRVTVAPKRAECGPGEVAEFSVQVRDHAGRGARSQVALWAVDEGVLALTGFTTPDVISRMYAPRGVGSAFWSTIPYSITSDPRLVTRYLEREMMMLSAVVMGATVTGYSGPPVELPGHTRTTFRTTAFYLGNVATDERGMAEARAHMPDNLTTFRVMAVAVGSDDRFGSGDASLLVTRALVARPSLPRFVRPSDSLYAGAAITARDGKERTVMVTALDSTSSRPTASRRDVQLERLSKEARFDFVLPPRDSARDSMRVTFTATDGVTSDAVRSAIPVRPDFHVRAHTAFGLLRGKGDVSLTLPGDIDPAKSRVVVRVGTTPLAPMLAAYRWLDTYPYDCTEQIASIGRALIAVWEASAHGSLASVSDPRTRLQNFADELARRQRPDGAIGYWRDHHWTSPWLSAYAGQFLLDARGIGIVVDSGVVRRLGDYLQESVGAPADTGGMNRFERQQRRLLLGERVSSVSLLRRIGRPEIQAEDELLAIAAQMTWEDRLRLAEALSTRADVHEEVVALVDAAWNATARAGNRVDVPDSAHSERAFPSHVAPAASLLSASLRLNPDHPLLGGLIETVLQQGRAARGWAWSTQDYASVVMALAALPRSSGRRTLSVSVAGRVVLSRNVAESDSVAVESLNGMLVGTSDGTSLQVHLDVRDRGAMYYAITVHEVPSKAPTTPDIHGIVVERWYERFDDGRPVTQLTEGDLVRVRLRLTVPADRQFVALEDPLPAGLEPVDLSLRTSSTLAPFVTPESENARRYGDRDRDGPRWQSWLYGSWDDGWWSPWEHKEMHDDRVVYFARMLWRGSYTASYVARATTSGSFVRPPAYAEEMYNPALQGRSDGGRFEVTRLP